MGYGIRNALPEDMPVIEAIYARAREFMRESGNPNQWGTENPPAEVLTADIQQGTLYVLTDEGGIHGVFFFALGADPTYREIYEGSWRSSEPYGTVHRIAADGSGGVLSAALEFCRIHSSHLRIDTHADNRIMQKLLERQGFSRRGIIYIRDGSARIAYDWLACE